MKKGGNRLDFAPYLKNFSLLKKKTPSRETESKQSDCCDNLGNNQFHLQDSVVKLMKIIEDKFNNQNDVIQEINNKIKNNENENIKLKMVVDLNDDENIILSNEQLKILNQLKIDLDDAEYKDFEKEINKKVAVNRIKKFMAYFELIIPIFGAIISIIFSSVKALDSRFLNVYSKVLNKLGNLNKERILDTLNSLKEPTLKALKITNKLAIAAEEENIMKVDELVADKEDKENRDDKIDTRDNDTFHNIFAFLANMQLSIRNKVNVPSMNITRNYIANKITIFIMLFALITTVDIYYDTNYVSDALKTIGVLENEQSGGGKKNKKKQKRSLKYYNDMIIKSLENSITKKKNSY